MQMVDFPILRKYVLLGDDDNPAKDPKYAGYVVVWRGGIPTKKLPPNLFTKNYNMDEGVYKNGIYDTILLKDGKR